MSTYTTNTNAADAQAIIDAVKELYTPQAMEVEKGDIKAPIILVPKGFEIQSAKPLLDDFREAPERRRGTATLQDIDSFIAHANRFKNADSALFAHHTGGTNASIRSVFDYHCAGPDGAPRYGQHCGLHEFPMSDEWLAWHRVNEKKLEQASLAEFLEDRIVDVVEPASVFDRNKELADRLGIQLTGAAGLLTLSRELAVNVECKIANSVKLSSGEAQLVFEENHRGADGKPVRVPNGFLISIPVFRGGVPYQIPARLRYSVRSGDIKFSVHLSRLDAVFMDAFREACERARTETDLPLFYGSPE